MKREIIAILIIFVAFALAELLRTGLFRKKGQRQKDSVVEVIGTLTLLLITQPLVLLGGGLVAATLLPDLGGSLAAWPLLAQIGMFLVFDDMTQYWWHRMSHNVKWLYELHRPHHDAEYMSIRIVYRNNVFYYLLMPGIWFSGALIYLGLRSEGTLSLQYALRPTCAGTFVVPPPYAEDMYEAKVRANGPTDNIIILPRK